MRSKKIQVLLLTMMVFSIVCTGAFGGGGREAQPVNVENWPTRTIRFVAQSEAGGSSDLFIRPLQPFLQRELGVPIVVENMPGAAGRVASSFIWRADPDGYTLLCHNMPQTTVGEILFNTDYSILEMPHIVSFDIAPYVLIVRRDSPFNSLRDIVNASRTQRLTNGTSGVGGTMHLQSAVMRSELGINYDDIPFGGSGAAMLAVMSRDVDFCILPFDIPINNQDEVKIISSFADERMTQYPNIRTPGEEGIPFTYLSIRRSIIAPPGTPREIIDILIRAFRVIVDDPEVRRWADSRGIIIDPLFGNDALSATREAHVLIESLSHLLR